MISEIEKKIWSLVEKNVVDQGFDLIDVKVRRAQKDYMVEILVDRPQGGITIDECAMLNRQIVSLLEAQVILDADYMLDVSSPGIDRVLRKARDLIREQGKKVDVTLYAPLDGQKNLTGVLTGFDGKAVTLDQSVTIELEKAAQIGLDIDF